MPLPSARARASFDSACAGVEVAGFEAGEGLEVVRLGVVEGHVGLADGADAGEPGVVLPRGTLEAATQGAKGAQRHAHHDVVEVVEVDVQQAAA